jgi:L-seryl-tRNA(Ser) seleniumtransferase
MHESIHAGADLVMASGDKLLGGPQAGLILGRAAVVERVARHPLARAMRADKSALAGLAATLRHYLRGEAEEQVPVWWSISRKHDWLRERVLKWLAAVGTGELRAIEAVVGGGALPGRTLPSYALALSADEHGVDQLATRLRLGSPPVVGRVERDALLIDARTVLPGQDDALIGALRAVSHISG